MYSFVDVCHKSLCKALFPQSSVQCLVSLQNQSFPKEYSLISLTCFLLGVFLLASATTRVPGTAGVLQCGQHSWEQQQTYATTLSLWPFPLIPYLARDKPGTVPLPITSIVRLCEWALLLPEQTSPSLKRMNPIWCQQAWCWIGHCIFKNPQILAVMPAMKPCMNRLSPSISSSVVAFSWKYRGECNLCPRFSTVMQQRAPSSKHQTHLSVWVFKPQHWCKLTLVNILNILC